MKLPRQHRDDAGSVPVWTAPSGGPHTSPTSSRTTGRSGGPGPRPTRRRRTGARPSTWAGFPGTREPSTCSRPRGCRRRLPARRRVLDDVRDAVDGAPGNVRAIGHVSRAEVMKRLFTSDVFVFPSHREGFPNSVLEAMAAGLPVVAAHAERRRDDRGRPGRLPDLARGRECPDGGSRPVVPESTARPPDGRPQPESVFGASFTFSAVFGSLCGIYENLAAPVEHFEGWTRTGTDR